LKPAGDRTAVFGAGHNDMPYVDMLPPPLTTVRIAQRDIGNQGRPPPARCLRRPAARSERVVLGPCLQFQLAQHMQSTHNTEKQPLIVP
jgi:hypothetical protein